MEWVQRFRAAGAAADLDDLGVEVDDDMDHFAQCMHTLLRESWLRLSIHCVQSGLRNSQDLPGEIFLAIALRVPGDLSYR